MNQVTFPWPQPVVWRRWLLRVSLVILCSYVIYLVRDIWLPLGLAFLIATILDPVVDRMESRGWKRTPATCAIFFSFLIIVVGLIVLAIPHLVDQIGEVQSSFAKYFPDTTPAGLTKSFAKLKVPSSLAGVAVQSFTTLQHGVLKSSSWLTEYGMSFVSNLVWVIIVPIVAFYALRDYHLILGKVLLLAPKKHRDSVQIYVAEVSEVFARYLRGLGVVSFLNGVATWALLAFLHVPSAMLLGIIAGVLYSVPYIGALLTVAFTAAASFVAGGVHLLVLAVVLSMVLHQVLFDQIITPRILGGHVGLHPILSILALLVGNLLLGIIGMVLAVPVAACIQIGVLALVPKLREEIDLGSEPLHLSEHLAAVEKDTKHEQSKIHQKESLQAGQDQATRDVVSTLDAENASEPAT